MAIEHIVRKIEEETLQKVREIEISAEQECSAILRAAEEKANEIKERIYRESARVTDMEKNKISVLAHLESNKEILSEKNKYLDRVFETAAVNIKTTHRKQYLMFLEKLLESCLENVLKKETSDTDKKTSENTAIEIILSAGDLLHIKNEILVKYGKDNVCFSTGDLDGGFIIKTAKRESNYTMEALIRGYREKILGEVARILF